MEGLLKSPLGEDDDDSAPDPVPLVPPCTTVPPGLTGTAGLGHQKIKGRYHPYHLTVELPTVVGPVKKSLPLTFAARLITRLAMKFDLSDMSSYCLPPPDLSKVLVRHSAAHTISAVPLKPAARIVGVYPSVLAPYRQRLARIDAEVVE